MCDGATLRRHPSASSPTTLRLDIDLSGHVSVHIFIPSQPCYHLSGASTSATLHAQDSLEAGPVQVAAAEHLRFAPTAQDAAAQSIAELLVCRERRAAAAAKSAITSHYMDVPGSVIAGGPKHLERYNALQKVVITEDMLEQCYR